MVRKYVRAWHFFFVEAEGCMLGALFYFSSTHEHGSENQSYYCHSPRPLTLIVGCVLFPLLCIFSGRGRWAFAGLIIMLRSGSSVVAVAPLLFMVAQAFITPLHRPPSATITTAIRRPLV